MEEEIVEVEDKRKGYRERGRERGKVRGEEERAEGKEKRKGTLMRHKREIVVFGHGSS